jgi:putative pyruvate formate lyase activating enzyme
MVNNDSYDRFSLQVRRLAEKLNPCTICPRRCRINRLQGQIGFCGVADKILVSSVGPHFGEESVLVGIGGSGTIFFAGCNLGCIFCQNYDISHLRQGSVVSIEQLADFMIGLQTRGCSNINLVTPTHLVVPIAAAIEIAKQKGLVLPIVYNTGGYDSVETLKLLERMIDIYMPDMKYSEPEVAEQLSNAADYPEINFAAVNQMHQQVGDLKIEDGLAVKGLLVRHLVLPNNLARSFKIIDFLSNSISRDTAINVMGQYRPCYEASKHPKINRRPTVDEIKDVRRYAQKKGLRIID